MSELTAALKRDFGRGNHAGYQNSDAFRLTDEIMETADPDQEDQFYAALTEIFRADMPFTRLLPWTRTCFAHRRVRGLRTPFHADPDTYIEDLWLEDESSR
jgi:hypothetical protein